MNVVIPRPSQNGDLIPGVGKVSDLILQDKWRSGSMPMFALCFIMNKCLKTVW